MFWCFRKSWLIKLTKRLKRYEHKYRTSHTYRPKMYWWISSFLLSITWSFWNWVQCTNRSYSAK
jgi:hypothetical protein